MGFLRRGVKGRPKPEYPDVGEVSQDRRGFLARLGGALGAVVLGAGVFSSTRCAGDHNPPGPPAAGPAQSPLPPVEPVLNGKIPDPTEGPAGNGTAASGPGNHTGSSPEAPHAPGAPSSPAHRNRPVEPPLGGDVPAPEPQPPLPPVEPAMRGKVRDPEEVPPKPVPERPGEPPAVGEPEHRKPGELPPVASAKHEDVKDAGDEPDVKPDPRTLLPGGVAPRVEPPPVPPRTGGVPRPPREPEPLKPKK